MYTYGPVPSRRLGRSLGVSLVPPKTCSYSCVYCQLGRTTHLQARRGHFFPREDILAEIGTVCRRSDPQYVTFVGDGEPTICEDLGWLIGECKHRWPVKVAVITNGSLLDRSAVRDCLLAADVVIPSLDAGCEETFRAVNRPHHCVSYSDMLEGQVAFRSVFQGQLWEEIMLVKGMNDNGDELSRIAGALKAIQPDRIYVVTPIRPPAEPWVHPPDESTILKAQRMLGNAVAVTARESGEFGLREFTSAKKAIIEIGSRHPLRVEQAETIERRFTEPGMVRRMIAARELIQVEHDGHEYVIPGHFNRGWKEYATEEVES